MESIVGVRFQPAGKVYYFSPEGFADVEVGEYVVVETSRGQEVARIVIAPSQVVLTELSEPLKPITRYATDDDLEHSRRLQARAQDDTERARVYARAKGAPMKIVEGSYNLDGNRLTLFFLSEGRVDFRDLIRELSHELHVQVQLRQVGPRDQAKAADGYGRCGRRLCCSSWLTVFPAISIKMAKEQDLPLNPLKISGMCGRLLCCLAYENDTYKQLKSQLPRPGTIVSTPSGEARVLAANALRQVVTLQLASSFEVVEIPAATLALDKGVVRVVALPEDADADHAAPDPFAALVPAGERGPDAGDQRAGASRPRGPRPGPGGGPRPPHTGDGAQAREQRPTPVDGPPTGRADRPRPDQRDSRPDRPRPEQEQSARPALPAAEQPAASEPASATPAEAAGSSEERARRRRHRGRHRGGRT